MDFAAIAAMFPQLDFLEKAMDKIIPSDNKDIFMVVDTSLVDE